MENQLSLRQRAAGTSVTVFRVLRILFIVGLLAGGASQLFGIDYQQAQFTRLGYPLYLMRIIGSAKLLAALVVALHRWPLLTVAAYVGGFVVAVCAGLSHFAAGDSAFLTLTPLGLTSLCLALSWLDPTLRCLQK